MQSKCNKYNRQQSEQYMWKTCAVDRWTWYSRCNHRKVQLKNGRPTIDLAVVYPLYSFYSIFTPTWISIVLNCPSSASCFIQCSLVHWMRLCSREIVCTCPTFRTFFWIAVYLNFHCKTNMTQLMTNKEKNVVSLRSLTAVLQLLEKETDEETWTHQTPETHSL